MASEFGNALAKLAGLLRSWQGDCEFGKVVANLARWFANLARLRISLASEIVSEKRISQCVVQVWLANFTMWAEIANCLRNSQGLRIGCQQFANFAKVANWLRKSYFAVLPCLSSCLQLHLISSTFPLFFH